MENNNSFVRGKKKSRQEIEWYVLSHYNMEKPDAKGWEYFLYIPYETDEDLEQTIDEILVEADQIADSHYCFIEADVRALDGSDRSW